MSSPLAYSVPFELLVRELTLPILRNAPGDVSRVYRGFVERMCPAPTFAGLEHLPADPRFILAANHYQRKGLWIAHAASALAVALSARYGTDPPIRWVVTANWPRWKFGPLTVRSPGDLLLPRVARALCCYAVPFAGTNPAVTALSLRRVLKDSGMLRHAVGLFPEGARAVAGQLAPALPGVGRFISLMAARGWPVVPAGISENGGFTIRFGPLLDSRTLANSADPGRLTMERVGELARKSSGYA